MDSIYVLIYSSTLLIQDCITNTRLYYEYFMLCIWKHMNQKITLIVFIMRLKKVIGNLAKINGFLPSQNLLDIILPI